MLRHYTLMNHESCQSIVNSNFKCFLLLTFLFFGIGNYAQEQQSFQIQIIQLEYIDGETQEHKFLSSEDFKKELRLSRNYNHVFVELEKDPSIQYAYKVTGEAGLANWKNTTNEIHLVGLSRGAHQLCIRGERNGTFSELQQFKIFVTTPFYLRWWFISLIIIIVVGVFYLFLVLEAKLLK
jgi:hypothetical protein